MLTHCTSQAQSKLPRSGGAQHAVCAPAVAAAAAIGLAAVGAVQQPQLPPAAQRPHHCTCDPCRWHHRSAPRSQMCAQRLCRCSSSHSTARRATSCMPYLCCKMQLPAARAKGLASLSVRRNPAEVRPAEAKTSLPAAICAICCSICARCRASPRVLGMLLARTSVAAGAAPPLPSLLLLTTRAPMPCRTHALFVSRCKPLYTWP